MSTTTHLDLIVKDDYDSAQLERILRETRAFSGCLGVELFEDRVNRLKIRIVEQWESIEAEAAYREFRAGNGQIKGLSEMLAAPPVSVSLAKQVF